MQTLIQSDQMVKAQSPVDFRIATQIFSKSSERQGARTYDKIIVSSGKRT